MDVVLAEVLTALRLAYSVPYYRENTTMKHVTVQQVGSEQNRWEIHIQTGAIASEILTEINMEHYQLAVSPNAIEAFHEEEDVYAQINEGDTLYALTSTEVADNYILSFFNKEGDYA
jgi:hypothetical protein